MQSSEKCCRDPLCTSSWLGSQSSLVPRTSGTPGTAVISTSSCSAVILGRTLSENRNWFSSSGSELLSALVVEGSFFCL
jgi:hypothetical protein